MITLDRTENKVYIVSWDTNKILNKFDITELRKAKKVCKNYGHTGEDIKGHTGYPPIAMVQNHLGECMYNPRFKKDLGD